MSDFKSHVSIKLLNVALNPVTITNKQTPFKNKILAPSSLNAHEWSGFEYNKL